MKWKRKREVRRKFIKSDRKINKRNKNLMIDKILSYNPMLKDGIELYKDANRNFTLLIFLGALLVDFPLISIPCCILAIFFVVKMLQYVRYKSINSIVIELAKDLSFRGIYDKEKVDGWLVDFKDKYGDNIIEFEELVEMIGKYEAFVTKIEFVLKNARMQNKRNIYNKEAVLKNGGKSSNNKENSIIYDNSNEDIYKNKKINNHYIDFNEKLSVMYKKEGGELKKVNKAIEFFDAEDSESFNNHNAVVLNNTNKNNKNLTVYLYKKSSVLQKNIL